MSMEDLARLLSDCVPSVEWDVARPEAAEEEAEPDEGSTAGNTAESGNTSEKAAEADTTEGETGN